MTVKEKGNVACFALHPVEVEKGSLLWRGPTSRVASMPSYHYPSATRSTQWAEMGDGLLNPYGTT